MRQQMIWTVLTVAVICVLMADGLPADDVPPQVVVEGRKYYDKPSSMNGLKKIDGKEDGGSMGHTSGGMSPPSILHQLDWKTLISTAMKMFFGSSDEQSKQASKQMVDMIVNLIDHLRLSFTMRRAQARSTGQEGAPTTDAALAGLSMLKAYVKTITSQDEECVKKYLCQANREAVKDSNKVGYMIAQFGSYATSYMLENFHLTPFDDNFNASKEGRNGANCEEVFQQCNELH